MHSTGTGLHAQRHTGGRQYTSIQMGKRTTAAEVGRWAERHDGRQVSGPAVAIAVAGRAAGRTAGRRSSLPRRQPRRWKPHISGIAA